jgi:hypothetical protein
MLRRIFGHTREEVTEGWQKYVKEHHNLQFSQNIVRIITLRRIR